MTKFGLRKTLASLRGAKVYVSKNGYAAVKGADTENTEKVLRDLGWKEWKPPWTRTSGSPVVEIHEKMHDEIITTQYEVEADCD